MSLLTKVCSSGLVLLGLVGVAPSSAAIDVIGAPWPWQKSAPVLVVGVKAAQHADFTGFQFVSCSPHRVVLLQLGWVVRSFGTQAPPEVLDTVKAQFVLKGVSFPFKVDIAPKQKAPYSMDALSGFALQEELERRAPNSKMAIAYFGIVLARFADGSEWRYDLVNSPDWDLPTNLPADSYPAALPCSPGTESSAGPAHLDCCNRACVLTTYCVPLTLLLQCCPCYGTCTHSTFCGVCEDGFAKAPEKLAEVFAPEATPDGA
jgi:hypothetical protein